MKSQVSSFTITCSRPPNYGAVLQTYGLNKKLEKLGVNARVLDYDPSYYYKSNRALPIRLVRNLLRAPDLIKGRHVFGRFLEQYVPMSEVRYKTLQEIEVNTPLADVYIAGSDQIWNCKNKQNGKDDAFFLSFVPEGTRKVAYAASIAMPEIPEDQRSRYRRLISRFDAVSVREKSAVSLLRGIGIEDVTVVCDPVFLLDRNEWDVLADESTFTPCEEYVLVYGYNRQKNVYAYARELANSLGVKLYVIGTAIEDFLLDNDRYFWNASPNTFISLIRNAKAVVTNSFHGTVFSVIYNIPFHFFTVKQTTNSRMLDLLSDLDLTSRLVDGGRVADNAVDFSKANERLNYKKQQSISFLREEILGEA